MAAKPPVKALARDREPLDALLFRVLGGSPGPRAGVVEAVLEANPGLAAMALALPSRTVVVIPQAVVQTPAVKAIVNLWD
jgi:phage tail protein X